MGARTLILAMLSACSSAPAKPATPAVIPADAAPDAVTSAAPRITADVPPPLVPEPRRQVVMVTSDSCGLVLETVHFPAGSAMPAPTAARVLDGNAAFLVCLERDGETLLLEVGGHADDREPDALTLSDSRATVIKGELVRRGVNPGWLVTQGYAASQPIDRTATPAGRAKNRRVELLVLRRP